MVRQFVWVPGGWGKLQPRSGVSLRGYSELCGNAELFYFNFLFRQNPKNPNQQILAIANICYNYIMEKRLRKRGGGSAQKKVLLLLLGGITLGLSPSPSKYFRAIKYIREEWKEINRGILNKAIRSLYSSHLVETKNNGDGTTTLVLSKEGKQVALTFNIENMSISIPRNWDNKWRIVMFDIPEKLKKIRESLRINLRGLGFIELQKSVFVYPYYCTKEIEYVVEFYNIRRHVRFIVADNIDNELDLKRHFKLL